MEVHQFYAFEAVVQTQNGKPHEKGNLRTVRLADHDPSQEKKKVQN